MTTYVQKPDFRVLDVIAGLAGHHGRNWCYPSLAKLVELIQRHSGRVMSTRTLIRHINAFVRGGYLRRIRRHKRARNGSLELHSTCYVLVLRGLHRAKKLLRSFGQVLAAAASSVAPPAVTQVAQNKTISIGSIISGVIPLRE